nr:MAG TPA: terminase small subunit [Caudoviricetes sp.]
MARKANPQRAESLKRYLDKKGKITIEELANLAGVPKKTISKWKCEDKWEEVLKQQPKKKGGQLGNKNAAGKTPKKRGNRNAVTHGAYVQAGYADVPEATAEAIKNLSGGSMEHLQDELKTLLVRREYLQQQLVKYTDAQENPTAQFYVDKIVHMIVPASLEEQQAREAAGIESSVADPEPAEVAEQLKTAMKTVIKSSPFDRAMKIQTELTKLDGRILKAIDSMKSYEIEDKRLQLERLKYELAVQRLTGEIEIADENTEEIVDFLPEGE